MGVYSYGYKAGKQILKKIFKNKTGSGEVIKKVKPNVPQDRLSKATRDLILAKQKTKGSTAKLKQTQFEIDQANKGKGDYNFTFDPLKANVKKKSKLRENKMGGGMMGRRMGYKAGSNGSKKGKVPTTPKEKAFGMLSVKKGLDNNKNITFTDKIAGAKKS
tara:strand:- start:44 stop:526 length:483 start_codon:yes stop_codon:yes gene_type:complete